MNTEFFGAPVNLVPQGAPRSPDRSPWILSESLHSGSSEGFIREKQREKQADKAAGHLRREGLRQRKEPKAGSAPSAS